MVQMATLCRQLLWLPYILVQTTTTESLESKVVQMTTLYPSADPD